MYQGDIYLITKTHVLDGRWTKVQQNVIIFDNNNCRCITLLKNNINSIFIDTLAQMLFESVLLLCGYAIIRLYDYIESVPKLCCHATMRSNDCIHDNIKHTGLLLLQYKCRKYDIYFRSALISRLMITR